MNRAVFLDRDGVINKIVYHQDLGILDTPFTPSQFELLPGVAKSIRTLNRLGLLTILVSNQPGMAKGHYDHKTFRAIEKKMFDILNKNKAKLDGAYYCFHHPEGRVKKYRKRCNCRKPKAGLLLKAAQDFDLDLKSSYLIGDGIMDIQAGKSVGCITFLVGNHKCDLCRLLNEKKIEPDFIVPNLYQAVKIIKQISFPSSVNLSEVPQCRILATRIEALSS
jgi:D-glycero-D-manno-heptose 1,7-bisphosphate phosphatase